MSRGPGKRHDENFWTVLVGGYLVGYPLLHIVEHRELADDMVGELQQTFRIRELGRL